MKLQEYYYHNLDEIPAYNFQEFLRVNDFTLLMKKKVDKPDPDELLKIWDGLFQEYLDFMGMGDRQDLILRKENRVCKLILQVKCEGQRHLQAILNQEKKELDLLRGRINTENESMEGAAMSKYLGFHVNRKEISAKEYFSYIKLIKSDG